MSTSVGRLGKRFGLSRSALLYYDRIRLLSPSARSRAGYRVYSERDAKRLAAICRYREVGLSLEQIRELLEHAPGRSAELLEARLDQLNAEIDRLREQQRIIVRLLANPKKPRGARAIDKDGWVAILRAAGLDDAAMQRWHVEFESMAPKAHQDFLASLGLAPGEIARIRRWSRAADTPRRVQPPLGRQVGPRRGRSEGAQRAVPHRRRRGADVHARWRPRRRGTRCAGRIGGGAGDVG
jgi:DNA-binding transcriptional MerR regulator